jgi:serine/threonine-protein kinase RsbW
VPKALFLHYEISNYKSDYKYYVILRYMAKLSVENRIAELTRIEKFISHFSLENNLTPKINFELNLILEELITNLIYYGFPDNGSHIIDIMADIEDDNIRVHIIDDGIEFDPLNYKAVSPETPLHDKPVGGLGIFLVKQKVNEIHYQRKENKNILSLIRKINTNGERNGN